MKIIREVNYISKLWPANHFLFIKHLGRKIIFSIRYKADMLKHIFIYGIFTFDTVHHIAHIYACMVGGSRIIAVSHSRKDISYISNYLILWSLCFSFTTLGSIIPFQFDIVAIASKFTYKFLVF